VTDCPARLGSLTTETIALYTTVCPISEAATSTPIPVYTTSTVYSETTYTITSCAPTITDCPAKLGSVTTETIALYTTVCPVASIGIPGGAFEEGSSAETISESSRTVTTLSSTFSTYVTVKVIKSTISVVPLPPATGLPPSGPHPTGTAVEKGVSATSVILVGTAGVNKPIYSAAGFNPLGATPTPSPFKGAGSKLRGSSMALIVMTVLATVALMI